MQRTIGITLVLVGVLGSLSAATAGRFQFEEEEIVGEVQKPEITVIISRENLNKAYEFEFDEDFLERIVDSVEYEPF